MLVVRAMQGFQSAAVAVALLISVLALGTVAFSFGWLGGGDVKLAAAVAASFTFPDAVAFLLYTAIAGGAFALLYAAVTRRGSVIRNVGVASSARL